MSRPAIHRGYIVDQTRELVRELALIGAGGNPLNLSPRELLEILHAVTRDSSRADDLRTLVRAEASLLAGRALEAEVRLDRLASSEAASDRVRGLAMDRLGDLHWWRGDFAVAASHYRQSLELRPQDQRTRKDLARALWHLGQAAPTDSTFGGDTRSRVAAPPGAVVHSRPSTDVVEVYGLYVSSGGAGLMIIQGCVDDGPAMVATGSLGATAQEACDLAWAIWRRSRPDIAAGVRVHAPRAGVLKDGPSLGLAVYVLFGAVLQELRPDVGDAFTGEIDLRGNVLPIGGARDKALAAYLSGVRRVFLPRENLAELGESFDGILDLRPLSHVEELDGIMT